MKRIASNRNYKMLKSAQPGFDPSGDMQSPEQEPIKDLSTHTPQPGGGSGRSHATAPKPRMKRYDMNQITGGAIKDPTSGNAFRAWVANNYPDSARKLQLSKTGPWNNGYILRAWNMHGKDYVGRSLEQATAPAATPANVTPPSPDQAPSASNMTREQLEARIKQLQEQLNNM